MGERKAGAAEDCLSLSKHGGLGGLADGFGERESWGGRVKGFRCKEAANKTKTHAHAYT